MLIKNFIRFMAISVVLFFAQGAMAAGTSWKISKISGQVILTKYNQEPQWAELNNSVSAGDKIVTMKNGSVALTRNSEAMIISANSEVEIPRAGNDSSFTMVFQKLGTVLFSAKKKNKKHFQVRTPYSAAIVKGTTFAVNVNGYNAQIQVFEGKVAVKGRGRKKIHQVTAGQKTLIPRDQRKKVLVNRVKNASRIHPHLGSNIDKLSSTYLNKIVIGGGRGSDNKFTHNIFTRVKNDGTLAGPKVIKPKKAPKGINIKAEKPTKDNGKTSVDASTNEKSNNGKKPETGKKVKADKKPDQDDKVKDDKKPKKDKEPKAEKEAKEDKKPKKEKEPKAEKKAKEEKKPKKEKEAKAEKKAKEEKKPKKEKEPKAEKKAKKEKKPKKEKEPKAEKKAKEEKKPKKEKKPKAEKKAKEEKKPKKEKEPKAEKEDKEEKKEKKDKKK